MKELARIAALYDKVDAHLEAERGSAVGSVLAKLESDQILNDQAYFLLCWGQLETAIDATCRAAIQRRSCDPNWQVRRSWYLYNAGDKRLSGLSFDDRTALVLDRAAGRGSPYAKTMEYYEARNSIAHGKLASTRLDITAFVRDCYVIQTALHRSA